MPITDTQRLILTAAAAHSAQLAAAPPGLPAAARNAVFRSMLKSGLLAEAPAAPEHAELAWRQDAAGVAIVLQLSDSGRAAISPGQPALQASLPVLAGAPLAAAAEAQEVTLAPEAALPLAEVQEAAPPAPGAPQRASLRQTAEAVLAAWDGNDGERLAVRMAALRKALAGKSARQPRDPAAPRQPRQGTKQEAVLALLRRAEGATVGQIAEATGWQQHTVRGFFAGLKKRGIDIAVLERVRQVGPDKQGAKGSYSVYRIAAAA